jgi:tryptophan 2,3-dioxygenase
VEAEEYMRDWTHTLLADVSERFQAADGGAPPDRRANLAQALEAKALPDLWDLRTSL